MNYNNLKNDNGIYLYQDNSFNTIMYNLSFLAENNDKTLATLNILKNYLLQSNKLYTYDEIINKSEELYNINYNMTNEIIGNKLLVFLNMDMISPSIIGENYTQEVYKFLIDILSNPDFTNQSLLDRIKKEFLNSYKMYLSNPNKIAKNLYIKNVLLPNENFKYPTKINDILEIYESITLDDLKETYNKTFKKENFYRGLIFGNITNEEYNIFKSYFPIKSSIPSLNYQRKISIPEGNIEIENKNIKETTVYVTYEIDHMNENLNLLLKNMLQNGSMICHKIIRDKYGLAYWAKMNFDYINNCVIFSTQIDYKNKDKLLKALDEIIDIIQNEEKLKEYLNKAKSDFKNNDYLLSEKKYEMIDILLDDILNIYGSYNYEQFIKKIDSYNHKDIKKYAKTLKRKNIFIYKGGANE